MRQQCVLILLVLIFCHNVSSFSTSWRHTIRSTKSSSKVSAFPEDFENRDAVDEVIKELSAKIRAMSRVNVDTNSIDEDMSIKELQQSFSQAFADLKQQSLSEIERMNVAMEAMRQADEEVGQKAAQQDALKTLPIDYFKTSLYSAATAPVLIAYGSGPVSERVMQISKGLGQAATYQYVDAAQLNIITEAELKYAVKNVKTIIIVADGKDTIKSGWFGAQEVVEAEPVITDKGLKRLLNAAMNEMNRQQSPIKVITLSKACKPPKSAASILTGDTTDLESEVILQCTQRQLFYNIIKVGKLISDTDAVPVNIKNRALAAKFSQSTAGRDIISSPLVITDSKIIEYNECTKHSIAAEALLRASTIAHRNASVSVLSVPGVESMPTDIDWNDEFLKVDGPELMRFPLRFADANQGALMMLKRFMRRVQEPGRGLVTPIKVELFNNALRIAFKPALSTYTSSKDEKQSAKEKALEEEEVKNKKPSKDIKTIRKSGYISPEEELRLTAMSMDDSLIADTSAKTVTNSGKKVAPEPLEGGLDIIIEAKPFPRIRVRRCLMGVKTVVKIESEKIILDLLQKEVNRLEADYRILSSLVK